VIKVWVGGTMRDLMLQISKMMMTSPVLTSLMLDNYRVCLCHKLRLRRRQTSAQ
jgi:hypothetical protein